MRAFVFVLGFVLLYFTYKQLFGYGIWGTLWRVVVALVSALVLASFLLWIDFGIHLYLDEHKETAMGFVLFEVLSIIAFVAILWISYLIGKPRKPKPEPEPVPVESELDEVASEDDGE